MLFMVVMGCSKQFFVCALKVMELSFCLSVNTHEEVPHISCDIKTAGFEESETF